MRSVLAIAALGFTLVMSAHAQTVEGLDGRWEGYAIPEKGKWRTVITVETKDGKTKAVADSPEQGTFGLPMTVKRDGDTATFTIAPGLAFIGKLSDDGQTITGVYSGPGMDIPTTFTRTTANTP